MAEKNTGNRLQKLSDSKYEIVDGEPNIMDWDVKDGNGKKLGEVEDLLFEEQSRRVRYLVVDLDNNDFDLESKEVLVPIGIAELHKSDDDVILPGITAEQLTALPAYDEDRFDESYETNVRNVFAGAGGGLLAAGAAKDGEFYSHDHFNDEKLYRNRKQQNESEVIPVIKEELQVGKQQVQTGAVRLRSRIVEENVSEDISLRQEKVNVARTDADRPATGNDFRRAETALEMGESEEVPVVSKEARVVEEVSLSKEVTERNEVVKDTVRNTEVDVDRDDDILQNNTGKQKR